MKTKQTLIDAGYESLNGESRIVAFTSNSSQVNFHRYVTPEKYDEFVNAKSDEERLQIKKTTPQITKEEYASASIDMFLERIDVKEWNIIVDGTRFVFYHPMGESFFQISNTQLMLHLTIFAENLGVPQQYIGLQSLAKEMMKNLKFKVQMMAIRNQDSDYYD